MFITGIIALTQDTKENLFRVNSIELIVDAIHLTLTVSASSYHSFQISCAVSTVSHLFLVCVRKATSNMTRGSLHAGGGRVD